MISDFVIKAKEGSNSAILMYDESKGYATYVTRAELEYNKIYTIIGVGLAITGDVLDGNVSTWFIGSSVGGSGKGANIIVDQEVFENSINPVSGGAVFRFMNESSKVKKISSVDELTDDPILYVL
jgi:hypothetical protein